MLTRADLQGRKAVNACHLNLGGKGSAWLFGVEGIPRLSVYDHYDKKTRRSTRTWKVDGKNCRDLDAALGVLNGEWTLEEAMQEAEQVIPPEAQRPGKVSVDAQIAEVDFELSQREKVYPRISATDPKRARENVLHVERMKAVRATLVWLRDNEATIKQRMSY
jgi:hypothetical protein